MTESGHAALEARLLQLLNDTIRQELMVAGDRILDTLRDEIQQSVRVADLGKEGPGSHMRAKMKRAGTAPSFVIDDASRTSWMFHRKSYAVSTKVRRSTIKSHAQRKPALPDERKDVYGSLPLLSDEVTDRGSVRSEQGASRSSVRWNVPSPPHRALGSISESSTDPCDASLRPDIPKLNLGEDDQGAPAGPATARPGSARSEATGVLSAVYSDLVDPLVDDELHEPTLGSKERPDELGRSPLMAFVQNPHFDRVAGFFIVLNAMTIAIETDYMAARENDRAPMPFQVVNSVFCALFTVELALRLHAHGRRFFTMQGAAWNWFDCIVVGTLLCDESLMIVEVFNEDRHHMGMKQGAGALRVLRTFRLFRALRLARALRLVRELNDIFVAMVKAVSALVWTIVLLGLIMFVVGVFLTQLVTDYKVHAGIAGSHSHEEIKGLPADQKALLEYWGSLHLSIQTLFWIISEGIDWKDASAPVTRQLSPWVMVVFAFYVVITIFGLLNIVTSVFVEAVIDSRDEGKRNALAEQLTQVFAGPNVDGEDSGTITPEDFQAHLQDVKMRAFLANIDITPEDAHQLFAIVDDQHTGEIPVEDFLSSCLRLQGDAKAVDLAIFMHEYRLSMERWDHQSRRMESMMRSLVEKDAATGHYTPRSMISPREGKFRNSTSTED